jgi:hypothetical protein
MDKEKKALIEMSDEELMDMFGGFEGTQVAIEPMIAKPLYGIKPTDVAYPLYGIKVAYPLYGIKVAQPLYGIKPF